MTERAEYIFAVKEYADGTPWIMAEPRRKQLSIFKNGFIGFDLRDGTSFEDAQQLAKEMTERITGITYTALSGK
jgi:hypothetical protein